MQDPPAPSPTEPNSPPSSARLSYGAAADPKIDLYEMLHIEPRATLQHIEEALKQAQRWWNGQQANPKYRRQAPEALARLREAKEILFDPIRRQEYDRTLQAFRQSYREVRWQPVRDLLELLLEDNTCDPPRQQLIVRFASRRGLTTEEIETMLGEEFLRRNIRWINDRKPGSILLSTAPPPIPFHKTLRTISALLSLSFCGLLVLPFFGMGRSAFLLLVPFFNDLRLLLRGLHPHVKADTDLTNAWDWLVGATVLGGSTLTALFDIQSNPLFPLGLSVASLIWLCWLALVWTWQKTPTTPKLPPPPPNPNSTDENIEHFDP